MKLEEILGKYGVPDPKIVGKLPKGGIQLDFVGHAEVTKMLIEIDPEWTWEPVAFDADGLPAYRVINGMAQMAGWMTIHGVRRLGIGSVQASKPDLLKELASDYLRNASMRFGICTSLWSKQEWESDDAQAETPAEPEEDKPLSQQQVKQFVDACDKVGLDPAIVADKAKLNWEGTILQSQLPLLRDAFTILKTGA
jgi:hypothetical protein